LKKSILLFLSVVGVLTSCTEIKNTTQNNSNNEKRGMGILFIVSNAHFYGDSDIATYNHFAEIVLAHDEFVKAGYSVDFVSPKGGEVAVGYLDTSNKTQNKYLNDVEFMNLLKNTKSPSEINPSDYIAVYYGGGGAAMFGVPENNDIQNISMSVYEENNGVVSAICHGSAGLAHLKTKNGKYLVEGKKVNGFLDKFENMEDPYYATFPFSIEQKLKDNGANFKFSEEGWDDFSIADGRLITGQDPTAARSVAKKVIETIKTYHN